MFAKGGVFRVSLFDFRFNVYCHPEGPRDKGSPLLFAFFDCRFSSFDFHSSLATEHFRSLLLRKYLSGGLRKWFQCDFVAQTLQPPHQRTTDAADIDPIKVVRAQFPIVLSAFEHVKGNHQ